jgi:hypothetical protein
LSSSLFSLSLSVSVLLQQADFQPLSLSLSTTTTHRVIASTTTFHLNDFFFYLVIFTTNFYSNVSITSFK